MLKQFYMTLPSNSKIGNTASIFETNLPVNINLNGEWEVGLSEMIYANTWNNVSNEQNTLQFYDVKNNIRQTIKIPPARYRTIEDLILSINQSVLVVSKRETVDYGSYLVIQYSRFRKTTEINLDSDYIRSVKFSPHLSYMLGFLESQFEQIDYKTKKIMLQAKHPPDMYGGLHYLYVYCDIVHPQIIGNVLAPILQVVNVEGEYMAIVNRVYITPNYVPVLKKSFNNINIEIKNDLNSPIDFEFGKTILKLHFKKC